MDFAVDQDVRTQMDAVYDNIDAYAKGLATPLKYTSKKGRVLSLKSIADYSTKQHDYVDERPLGYGLELDSGPNDVGKTATVCRTAARVILGTASGPWHGDPKGVLFILSEEDPGLIKNVMKAHGVTDFLMRGKLFTLVCPDPDGGADADDYDTAVLPDDVPALRQMCLDNDIKMVVIDTLIDCMEWANTNSQSDVAKAIRPLNKWAAEDDVLIVGIHHNNKSYEGTAKQAVAGSGAFTNKPRCVVSFDVDKDGQHVMQLVKVKGRSDHPAYRYDFETRSIELDSGGRELIGIVTKVTPTDTTIDKVRAEKNPAAIAAAKAEDDRRAAEHEVLDWLTDYLSDGQPVSFKTIKADAMEQNGYTERQLRNAKDSEDSGIVSEPDPNHKGKGRAYAWRLSD